MASPVHALTGTYVADNYGLLSDDEFETLENNARTVSETYDCGVYIVIVDDYTAFGYDPYEAAKSIYNDASLGVGSERSGVLLFMSMADRDYSLIAYGYGNTAVTDYGSEVLENTFLDNFRSNDWYGGFVDYIDNSGELLKAARNGQPVDYDNSYESRTFYQTFGPVGSIAISLLVGCFVAFIVCNIEKARMKSVARATMASNYVAQHSLHLTEQYDQLIHVSENRRRIEQDNDRDSGYHGGTSIDSDGFSGHSGKF